jgi:hypothetical protein
MQVIEDRPWQMVAAKTISEAAHGIVEWRGQQKAHHWVALRMSFVAKRFVKIQLSKQLRMTSQQDRNSISAVNAHLTKQFIQGAKVMMNGQRPRLSVDGDTARFETHAEIKVLPTPGNEVFVKETDRNQKVAGDGTVAS